MRAPGSVCFRGRNQRRNRRQVAQFHEQLVERRRPTSAGWGRFAFEGSSPNAGVKGGRFGSSRDRRPAARHETPLHGLYDYCSPAASNATVRHRPFRSNTAKSHHLCCSYFRHAAEKYAPRFGCGKCQVNVPCERRIPKKDKFRFELHFVRKEASPYPDVKTECSFLEVALCASRRR